MWRRFSLRVKLLLASLLVEVVMLVLLVGNSVRLIGDHLEQQMTARIQAIELAYKTVVALPLASRDYATLRDILDGWRKADDVLYMLVRDNQGRVLAASGWEEGRPLPAAGPDPGDPERLHVRFAVDYLGQSYGSVQYGLSTRFIAQAKRELLTQGAAIASLEVMLTLMLLSLIGYWLTRHLGALMRASAQVTAGDYGIRLKVKGNDEVAQLSERFNAMATAVENRVQDLRLSEQRARAIADYTYGWESWLRPDGQLNWVSPAVERVTGYSPGECEGMPEFPLPLVYADDLELVRRCHRDGLAGVTGQDQEFRIRRKDGRVVWVAMSWQPIYGDGGRFLGYRSSIRDISLEHFAREELAYQASHDALTGLYNRRAFEQRLQDTLEQLASGGAPRTLLYIDLDQFKLVNDTCGHSAGDQLLQEITALMNRRVAHGYLARLGGDEFGLLLEGGLDEALRQADKLIDMIHAHAFSHGGRRFQLGASVGVVAITDAHLGMDELLIAADQACYAAKDKGRNRVEVYTAEDAYYQNQRDQFLSAARITEALQQDRLCLHYQRIVPLRPDLPEHMEVLVRLVGEQGQLIPPGVFIPAAERFNLMPTVDRWVFRQVCQTLARQDEGSGTYVAGVNLSGLTLGDESLVNYVSGCLAANAIDPARLCFEITETAAIGNLDKATAFIEAVRRMGSTVALDDFGSGLSSFAYLRRLPVDYLKIDGQFIKNLDTDPRDRAVVRSIIEVARVHGMATIAEYVHSEAIADILREMGVDYVQGFALHRPEPFC